MNTVKRSALKVDFWEKNSCAALGSQGAEPASATRWALPATLYQLSYIPTPGLGFKPLPSIAVVLGHCPVTLQSIINNGNNINAFQCTSVRLPVMFTTMYVTIDLEKRKKKKKEEEKRRPDGIHT